MKGKVNLKTIIVFTILILVIVLLVLGVNVAKTFMTGAAADFEPQNLTALPKEDGKSATVSWTTDKSTKASVFYGTNMASLLLMAEDVEATVDHNILLTNLRSNTTYYYKIVVDNDNTFDNGGMMYNFKTGGVDEMVVVEPSPTVALVPTIASSSAVFCNNETDYNTDGVINSKDLVKCKSDGGTVATPTVAITTTNKCEIGVDMYKGKIVNSFNRTKCLQGL